MGFLKRIGIFFLVNILVIATISIVLSILGVGHYLTARGIDYRSLMIFCLVWGMGGAFISLGISRMMAKWMMGVEVIDPATTQPELSRLVATVHNLAKAANLPAMPEVGVYDSPELNAFATGPTKSRALVAVSTGLLYNMNPSEVEGVLGHEITHIANGDMVTMTLIQGVINAFVMFLSRVIGFFVSQQVKEESRPLVNFLVVIVLDILLSILGSMAVAAFSRKREFSADRGGAMLAGRDKMIAALRALQQTHIIDKANEHPSLATLKISSGGSRGFLALLATHPPLEERIARLETM